MSDEILDPDAVSDAEWLPVRASLRDIVVPAEAREVAIAAALAAFDEDRIDVPIAAAAASLPTAAGDRQADVVLLQTRMGARWTRWAGTAAAAVAVLAVGGVVINGLGGSSGGQVSVEPATAAESTLSMSTAKESGMNATDMAPMSGSLESVDEQVAPSTIGSIDGGAAPDSTQPEVVVALAPSVDVADEAGLTTYATRTAAAPPEVDLPDSPCRPTGADLLGVVSYQGVTAIVVRNEDSSYSAIAADTCAVLATVTP